MHRLDDKTALITGGGSGLGAAMARNFAAAGARVIIAGRSDAGALAAEIGGRFVTMDVTREESVRAGLAAATEGGRLDILALNAGIARDLESLESAPVEALREMLAVNVTGVWFGLKYGPAHMNDGGAILVTGSAAGSGMTTVGNAEYAASKAAAAYLARTAAIELAPRAIRVNVLAPAALSGTGMMVEDDGSPLARFFGGLTALGRMGAPEDAAALANFLASDASRFITGQEIRVDGGMTAGFGLPLIEALSQKVGL